MAIQYSTDLRNAKMNVIESTISTAPILTLRTGAAPANCSQANSGTLIASMTLPSDWMAAASGGAVAKSGTWEDTSADAGGNIGHFRIHNSGGSECFIQGTCSNTGDGGDMTFDNITVNQGQAITVSTFTLTDGNA